jgi:hypothetical protein
LALVALALEHDFCSQVGVDEQGAEGEIGHGCVDGGDLFELGG